MKRAIGFMTVGAVSALFGLYLSRVIREVQQERAEAEAEAKPQSSWPPDPQINAQPDWPTIYRQQQRSPYRYWGKDHVPHRIETR